MSWGLENVTVKYDRTTALDSVTVDVVSGQITSVVGGDGAGKSTACRTLVGLASAVSGRVTRPEKIGFQPSTSGTWRDLSVVENLQLVAVAHRLATTAAAERIDHLLAATNLSSAADRLAGRLSGGMRQKLGVAMALLPEPELIVLDEPTTGVDPVSRLEIWAFIASAAGTGCAVLVTTTYVEEAARTNRVVALDAGTTLASGTPQDVVHAMPGAVFSSDTGGGPHSWRRGRQWRVWSPDGSQPNNAEPVTPDLDDVVTVAALAGGGEA